MNTMSDGIGVGSTSGHGKFRRYRDLAFICYSGSPSPELRERETAMVAVWTMCQS